MRLTARTDPAARVPMTCAANPGHRLRAGGVARMSDASRDHLLRGVNAPREHGVITTARGGNGGPELPRAGGVPARARMVTLRDPVQGNCDLIALLGLPERMAGACEARAPA